MFYGNRYGLDFAKVILARQPTGCSIRQLKFCKDIAINFYPDHGRLLAISGVRGQYLYFTFSQQTLMLYCGEYSSQLFLSILLKQASTFSPLFFRFPPSSFLLIRESGLYLNILLGLTKIYSFQSGKAVEDGVQV